MNSSVLEFIRAWWVSLLQRPLAVKPLVSVRLHIIHALARGHPHFTLTLSTFGARPGGRQDCWVTFCWMIEPDVSSNLLVLMKKGRQAENQIKRQINHSVFFTCTGTISLQF